MNSPKHHVKASDSQPIPKSTDNTKKLKEIPMLNMFLKTLQPSYGITSSTDTEKHEADAEESCSSNTEVER